MIDLARFGDAPAIETADGEVVTYRALDALVDQRASRDNRHARRGLVEVPAERSVDFIARCLGAWRGGRAFMPIDIADPRPRPPIKGRLATIDARGLAYAIMTSGSTGKPKIVRVGPRGLPALWRTQVDAFALGPGARSLWLYSPLFDASISDWGCALSSGATLVLPTDRAMTRISDELATRRITHVDLPPQLLGALVPPRSLRVVVLGGEACDVERVRALARTVRVVVVYGPTEATVCSSLVVVDPDRWTRPLIGNPLPGVTYRLIDGELHIGGDALALGYDDPEETARRFIDVDGMRMYKTGDHVERIDAPPNARPTTSRPSVDHAPDATAYPSGSGTQPTGHADADRYTDGRPSVHHAETGGLVFIGRVDRQVKLRGRRVELDEIELSLRRFCDAAVIVHRDRVVAFVERPVDRVALPLPVWMLPSRFVVGPLPRTPTGKIDRTALVVPPPKPTDPLALAWCHALGVDDVADTDRFDGDSLARLMLSTATGLDIVGSPTFASLRTRCAATALPPDCAKIKSHSFFARVVQTVRPSDKVRSARHRLIDDRLASDVDPISASHDNDVVFGSRVGNAAHSHAQNSDVDDTNVASGRASVSDELSASGGLSVAECEARGLASMSRIERASMSGADMHAATLRDDRAAMSRADVSPTMPRGAVLITGVTGFLGRALVSAWRRHHHGQHIIGLVRGHRGPIAGTDLISGRHPDACLNRGRDDHDCGLDIEVVHGDITALPDELRARVSTVVHCAATIQLGGDWDAHEHANVRGTAEVARWAAGMPWHHVSTLSVFVNTDHARGRHRPSDLPRGIAFGGYAQTKIAAEAIARASGAAIYRLGLLVDSKDDASRSARVRIASLDDGGIISGRCDQLAMAMRALAKLGAAPAGFRDERYDATPVEFAADAIARLAGGGGTHHISAGSVRFGDVVDRMQLDELPYDLWLERARAQADDPDIAMAIGAFSRRPELDLFLATHAEFS